MKKKSRIMHGIIIFFMLIFLGCNTKDSGEDNKKPSVNMVENENTKETTQQSMVTNSNLKEERELVTIETQYGNLYYQSCWNSFMQVEQEVNENSIIVTFQAEFHNVIYPLFQVTIGEAEGSPVGTLIDQSGTRRDVYIQLMKLEGVSALTIDEQNRLYAMQEEINYVIENLE